MERVERGSEREFAVHLILQSLVYKRLVVMALPDVFLQLEDGRRVKRASFAFQPGVVFLAHVFVQVAWIIRSEVLTKLALELNLRFIAATTKDSI